LFSVDAMHDAGGDRAPHADVAKATRPGRAVQRLNVDLGGGWTCCARSDVRPSEEYHAGHIPNALSVPLPELTARLRELPKRREIVAYCRGPYCVMAIDAVKILRANGYRAHRMEHGVAEWRAAGGRVQVGRSNGARP
jgi:rhodanese-related sulfurtransferase